MTPTLSRSPQSGLPRILILEDDQDLARDLCETVDRLGCEVGAVLRAEAGALRLAEELHPDLLVIDICSDDGECIAAASEMYARRRVPAVYLCESSAHNSLRSKLGGGAIGLLTKPVRSPANEAVMAVAVQQCRVLKDVLEEKSWLSDLLENIADGVISVDPEGRIDFINSKGEEIIGWSLEEARGLPVEEIYSLLPRDTDRYEQRLRGALQNATALPPERLILRTRGGYELLVEETVSPRRRNGIVTGAVAVFRDLSETVQHEQAQKYETIGILAGGVAHDFNNLLAVMVGNASLAMEMVPKGRARECLTEVLASGSKAADLTAQLLAYAGKATVRKATVDLAEEIRQLAAHLKSAIPRRIALQVDTGGSLPIDADSKQIRQIVMNLVLNASEAIGERSGSIDISAGFADSRNDAVFVQVRDTGDGMDAATRAKIFDPFFTTKFAGRGLGLAAVQGLVRAHGGLIDVDSKPGAGSTFTVLFPVASNHATALKEMPRLEALKGRETILVVDDIESVWRFARTALERLGYRVFVANDGKSALEILGARGRDIDLVLLDLSMPGMSGAEAGRKIGEKYPGIPICVMSGYNEEIAGRQFSSLMFSTDFIQKPFTQQQLASRLRAILDSVEWMEPARETGGGGMAHSSGE